jgi:hypothetical protein
MQDLCLFIVVTVFSAAAFAQTADAQQASYAVFDFEPGPVGMELVVAIQPERAAEIAGWSGDDANVMLREIRANTGMIAAYVESRVELHQGEERCAWSASPDPVGETLLEAQADGIAARGLVVCPLAHEPFTLETDLFAEIPGHVNEVRYRNGEEFVTLARLDRNAPSANVDLSHVFPLPVSEPAETGETSKPANVVYFAAVFSAILFLYVVFRKRGKQVRTSEQVDR